MTGTWAPPPGQPAPQLYGGPGPHQPPRSPSGSSGSKSRWAALAGILLATIAVTAGITYALVGNNPAQPPPTAAAGPEEQAAAKAKLCEVFDVATQDPAVRPPIFNSEGMNVGLVLRRLNGAVAVQNALTPAVPVPVSQSARSFIDTALAMTSAAGSNTMKSADINARIDDYNNAYLGLAASCGIPR